MAVPDFQTLMLPLLKTAADGQDQSISEAIDALAQEFRLSDEEREELLPSGRQARFDNRVGWARTYLKKAGLLQSTGRGRFRITERGSSVLKDNPAKIDMKFLEQFPEYVEFRSVSKPADKSDQGDHETDRTPEEVLEQSYQYLRSDLAEELLERIKECSPRFFEKLVVDLLVSMGYGGSRKDAGEAVGRSGDGGIDGTIKEDKLGLDVVYIQAKKWDGTVGRPVVQTFAGSLDGVRAKKGILITTSNFSHQASDYVERIEKKIVLIDGQQLAELMIDHNIGVAEVQIYSVKRLDTDYFGDT